jgi:hypothetical protein
MRQIRFNPIGQSGWNRCCCILNGKQPQIMNMEEKWTKTIAQKKTREMKEKNEEKKTMKSSMKKIKWKIL